MWSTYDVNGPYDKNDTHSLVQSSNIRGASTTYFNTCIIVAVFSIMPKKLVQCNNHTNVYMMVDLKVTDLWMTRGKGSRSLFGSGTSLMDGCITGYESSVSMPGQYM